MKKAISLYTLLLLMAVTMFSCGDDYDDTALRNDVNDLKSRVEKLESWCTTANSQISALQGLVTALQENDYVTGVTPIMEGAKETGYTITFAKGKPITIMHGKDGSDGINGVTPIIGVAKAEDGLYYWTVQTGDADVTWMLDAEGNKIRTTGDNGADGSDGTNGTNGTTPEISLAKDGDTYYWKLNGEWLMVDGAKVPATGPKGDTGATGPSGSNGAQGPAGDSFFSKVEPKEGYVEFTLAGSPATVLKLALYTTTVSFDAYTPLQLLVKGETADDKVIVTLPTTLKQDDFAAIKAEITSVGGTDIDIARSTPAPWTVTITAPIFTNKVLATQPVVKVTVPADVKENATALLKVTVVDAKGVETSSTRVLYYSTTVAVTSVTVTPATLSLEAGETETLAAAVLPAEAAQTVTWSSENTAVATVDADGKVTAVAVGTAVITATSTADGAKTGACTVTVTPVAVTGVSLADQSVNKGGTVKLVPTFTPANATNKTVTWSSSNTAAATIAADGTVTGVAAGTTTITVTTADGGKTATCTVTVTDGPKFENEGEAGIDGSSWEKAYTIVNKEQLKLLATRIKNADADLWNTKYYKLTADIDFGAENTEVWTPIGTGYSFKGHFDGGNHTINGKLIASAAERYFGIFISTKDAEIKNLNFEGSMDVSAATSLSYLGAIVAYATNTTIIHCSNAANLNTTIGMTGGIVGGGSGTIIACRNTGNITSNSSTGGILGMGSSTIIGCANSGNIESTEAGKYVGGIGTFNQTCIACWSNASSITGGYRGAIVGYAGTGSTSCYWKAITGLDGAGGTLSNSASFSGDTPDMPQIEAMNEAWETAQPSGREYQFGTNGEIVEIP